MPVRLPSARFFESRKFFNVSSMFVPFLFLKSDSRVFGLCPANLRIVINEAARYGYSSVLLSRYICFNQSEELTTARVKSACKVSLDLAENRQVHYFTKTRLYMYKTLVLSIGKLNSGGLLQKDKK